VGHLNELNAKFAEKGFTALGIAKQDRATVEKFVQELSATYPIVVESSDSMRNYGCSSYPSGFLVGSDGRVVWEGHPASLTDAVVEEALGKARLMPAFTKGLSSHQKSMEKLQYGAVLSKIASEIEKGKLADEDKAAAEALRDWLTWYATSAVEGVEDRIRKGDVYAAWLALADLEDIYKGHEVAKQAKDRIKALEGDKQQALEIKAGKTWAGIREELGDERRPDKVLEALQPLLSKKYAETKAGREAQQMAADCEKLVGK
jgi:hypothetical protein